MTRGQKALFIICLCFTFSIQARADFGQMTLFQLVLGADVILLGRVTHIGDKSLRLKKQSVLKGRDIAPNPVVQTTEKAAPGSRALVFAKAEPDGTLRPLGFSGEGLMSVQGGVLALEALTGTGKAPKALGTKVGETSPGFPVPIADFSYAITGFFACFALVPGGGSNAPTPSILPLCDSAALEAYASQPWPAGYFAAIAKKLTDDQ